MSNRGQYTYDIHGNCLIFKTPHPLSICFQNLSTPLIIDVQFQRTPLPPSPNPLQKTMEQQAHLAVNKQNQSKTNSPHV